MKRFLTLFLIFVSCLLLCGCDNEEIQEIFENDKSTDILLTLNQESTYQNQIWVGTFQLVWNDMLETINEGNPVVLLPNMPKCAKELNKRNFSKEYISEDSYYIKHGELSKALIKLMKKEIKEKFNETSDILDDVGDASFILYSMLKKNFEFKYSFDKLEDGTFGSNPIYIEYFGINDKSNSDLRKNIGVINYNDKNDYIIKLYTKSNDEIILYRTDKDKTLDKYWKDILSYTTIQPFGQEDKVKIPCLDFLYKEKFKDLIGKNIGGTSWIITNAIETVDLKMNEKGVKLKSEAVIIKENAMLAAEEIHNYYFDKPFVMFLVEKGKTTPYFGARIKDVYELNQR